MPEPDVTIEHDPAPGGIYTFTPNTPRARRWVRLHVWGESGTFHGEQPYAGELAAAMRRDGLTLADGAGEPLRVRTPNGEVL